MYYLQILITTDTNDCCLCGYMNGRQYPRSQHTITSVHKQPNRLQLFTENIEYRITMNFEIKDPKGHKVASNDKTLNADWSD